MRPSRPARNGAFAARIRNEVAEIQAFSSPQLDETLLASTRSALVNELSFMRHGREVPETCPPDAAEAARLAAAARMPATVVLRTHRIGHSVVWHAFVEEVDRLALNDALRREVHEAVSRFLFAYVDAL